MPFTYDVVSGASSVAHKRSTPLRGWGKKEGHQIGALLISGIEEWDDAHFGSFRLSSRATCVPSQRS